MTHPWSRMLCIGTFSFLKHRSSFSCCYFALCKSPISPANEVQIFGVHRPWLVIMWQIYHHRQHQNSVRINDQHQQCRQHRHSFRIKKNIKNVDSTNLELEVNCSVGNAHHQKRKYKLSRNQNQWIPHKDQIQWEDKDKAKIKWTCTIVTIKE